MIEVVEKIPEFADILGRETVEVLKCQVDDSDKIKKCYESIFQGQTSKEKFLSNQSKIYSRLMNDSSLCCESRNEFIHIFNTFKGSFLLHNLFKCLRNIF